MNRISLERKGSSVTNTLSDKDLTVEFSRINTIRATEGRTEGKWYWEVTVSLTGNLMIGISTLEDSLNTWSMARSYYVNGYSYMNASRTGGRGTSFAEGDVIGICLDMYDGALSFYKNGVFQMKPHTNLNLLPGDIYPAISSMSTTGIATINFGETKFSYPVPKGFAPYGSRFFMSDVLINETYLWDNDNTGNLLIEAFVSREASNSAQISLLLDDVEIRRCEIQATPVRVKFDWPKSRFVKDRSKLTIQATNESGHSVEYDYEIRRENREDFNYERYFDFKEDYIDDKSVVVIQDKGLALNKAGVGEAIVGMPTEGKAKIRKILIESTIKEEMRVQHLEMELFSSLQNGSVYKLDVNPKDWIETIQRIDPLEKEVN